MATVPPEKVVQVRKELKDLCAERTEAAARPDYRVVFRYAGSTGSIVEQRPHATKIGEWAGRNVAKLTIRKTGFWELSYPGPDGGWLLYAPLPSSPDSKVLVDAIRADAEGIFWGKRGATG